jgi:hypothetical protein
MGQLYLLMVVGVGSDRIVKNIEGNHDTEPHL